MIAIKAARTIMVSAIALAIVACGTITSEETPAPTRVDAADTSAEYSSARNYLETAQYGLAVTHIEAFLVAEPASAKGQALAGVIYDGIGRFDLADHHYRLALQLDPDSVAVKNNYALSKLQWAKESGRLDLANEALVLLDQAAAIDDKNAKIEHNKQEAQQIIADLQTRQAAASAPVATGATPEDVTFAPAAWLERRAASYTFVVTEVSASMADAITRLHIDPAIAMVSPGASHDEGTLPRIAERRPIVTRGTRRSTATVQWYRSIPRMLFARANAKGKLKPLTSIIHEALIDARDKGRPNRIALSGGVERFLVMTSIW